MKIGYACLTPGVEGTDFKHTTLNQAAEVKLLDIIFHNLTSLERMVDYNIEHKICMFRISSDIIPLASHPINTVLWWKVFSDTFYRIGNKIKDAEMRVSMHPGQYTVINSPRLEVVTRAIDDLVYHTRFLDALGLDSTHKIVLHIGGVYQDKEGAIKRFIEQYLTLSDAIKRRLVIENDDAYYTIEEVLEIGRIAKIPVVFDNFHHALNPSITKKSDREWIEEAMQLWTTVDGLPKIHYSQQNNSKRKGAHSETISIDPFLNYYQTIKDLDVDIMLEVKDKHRSVVKVLQVIEERGLYPLEVEWGRYKYAVLEHDQNTYHAIAELLKDKSMDLSVEFYRLVESALTKESTIGNRVNAAEHVWGYFKTLASEKERKRFTTFIQKLAEGASADSLKNFLWEMTIHYRIPYLLQSYYFSIE